jgi:RsmE family RNA methyltransferase
MNRRFFHFHSTTVRHLNRFLFHQDDLDESSLSTGTTTVTLPKDDYRTIHASKILGLENGDTVRAGVVSCQTQDHHSSGLLTDGATIEWIPDAPRIKKAGPLANGNPPGSLRIHLEGLHEETRAAFVTPPVSLLLALPRPLQLGRMLPQIAQLGVDHLILTQAQKVPKDYFGSHLFRKPALLTERLVEGLCQSGDVRLPQVHIVRHLQGFLETEFETLFPKNEYARVVAHPQRRNEPTAVKRLCQVDFSTQPRRLVLAVGPEGGWEEPDELDRFKAHGFEQVTLGQRILRSDVAVVSLLALAHDACHED